ncbi:hypothetical protein NDU88_002632, partial [Pleurodeles waltl]
GTRLNPTEERKQSNKGVDAHAHYHREEESLDPVTPQKKRLLRRKAACNTPSPTLDGGIYTACVS